MRLQVVQDHGRGHHRPGQRAAPGLVHAGHQARACPRPAWPVQPCKNFLDRIGGQLGGVALQFLVQRGESLLQGRDFLRRGPASPARAAASASRRGGVLQQLGHHEIAAQDVGQADPGLQLLAPHDLPGQPVHVVGNHHGALEQRRLQRGRAAGDQRHVAGGQHGVRLAVDDLQLRRPGPRPARPARSRSRSAGTAGTTNLIAGLRPLHKGCSLERNAAARYCDFGCAAARQDGHHRVVCAAGPAPPGGGPVRLHAESRWPADGRHRWRQCRAAPAARARTERCTAHGRRCGGSSRPARRARPRPRGRRNAPS